MASGRSANVRHNIMQARKIMFVIPSLGGGGAERVASNLLIEFSKKDVELLIVLFNKSSEKIYYNLPHAVKVRHIGISPISNIMYAGVKFIVLIIKLAKIIRDEKPDSVLCFMDYTNIIGILSNILAGSKARITISVRTSPTLHFRRYARGFFNDVISVFMKLLYNKADAVIAVSEWIRNDLIDNFNIDRARVVVIHNPVDIRSIDTLAAQGVAHPWYSEDIPIIFTAGRLSKEKGLDYLIKAFAIARKRCILRLVIMGEGAEEDALRNLSRSLAFDEDVAFLGFNKNPYQYMKRSAIYVLPSLYEGFPNVLVEAMACGLPVISTMYNPGANEIIQHEKNGLLVPVADEKALAAAILRLLNNPEESERYACEAKKKVEDYTLDKIADQYDRVLRNL